MDENLSEEENGSQNNEEAAAGNDSDDHDKYNDFSEGGWIQWFCGLEGNEFFAEIEEEFIRNKSNLYKLPIVKNHKALIEIITSPEYPSEDQLNEEFMENVNQAKELYGIIHARYITTVNGMAFIREKYLNGIYGHCPRVLCNKQVLLPVGLSEDLKYSRVKVFCPRCEDIFKPRQKCSEIDGAYFGTSFPHVFLMFYPDLNPKSGFIEHIPKLYGFKIFGKKGSKYYKGPFKTEVRTGVENETKPNPSPVTKHKHGHNK